MAMVNAEMTVSVNMPAIVSPTFVPGASPSASSRATTRRSPT